MRKKNVSTIQKILRTCTRKHVIITFAILFNVLVIAIIMMSNAIVDELDRVNARRILFHQPDPDLQKEIEDLLAGYPMVDMAPYIAAENRKVAAFLVAIAKKESAWGKHAPHKNGKDCYNYWGFRGKSNNVGSGGHTCFRSPEKAVRVVGRRIKKLIKKGYDTPQKMI